MSVNVVLLAGGEGSRLWPLSSKQYPKQFIVLPGSNQSSFQMALRRALELTRQDKIIIVANAACRDLLIEQIKLIKQDPNKFNIIFEKNINNTGIAVYCACKLLIENKLDNLTYFFPTDQLILDEENFLGESSNKVDQRSISVFSEKVSAVCSNFGYLIAGKELADNYFKVQKFIEKPNQAQIENLKEYTDLYRNLGIYLAKPSILLSELKKYNDDLPDIYFELNTHEHYADIVYKNLPIDKMIAEKSTLLNLIKTNFFWQDLGSFEVMYKSFKKLDVQGAALNIENIEKFNQINDKYTLEMIEGELRINKK